MAFRDASFIRNNNLAPITYKYMRRGTIAAYFLILIIILLNIIIIVVHMHILYRREVSWR
jgi:hypothetical protein